MPRLATIGVYGFDEAGFFAALQRAGVDVFCDIRRRRGVRGSAYAFANSARLQHRLALVGIRYFHCIELAPGLEMRRLQTNADEVSGIAKRNRAVLSPEFVEAYRREQLANFDSSAFLAQFGSDATKVALFCVEREPAACHRSLLAERLALDLSLEVEHLLP